MGIECREYFQIIGYFAPPIICLIFIIGNCVFSFMYIKYDFENDIIISEIESNINAEIIYSFEQKDSCSKDEKILILGKWDGTVEGCLCNNTIYERKCTNKDKANNCNNIGAKAPQYYTKINSTYICIKTMVYTYSELVKNHQVVNKSIGCDSLSKNCGIIDTTGNILCVNKDKKCPVNLNDIIKNDSLAESFPIGYNMINLDEKNILINTIKISQDLPCIYPNEKNWNYYYKLEYPSKKCETKMNEEINDFRYQTILQTTKYELYKDNNITQNLPNYNEEQLKNESISLYGRAVLGFNLEKIKDYSHEDLISHQKTSNKNCFLLRIFTFIIFGLIALNILILICDGGNCLSDGPDSSTLFYISMGFTLFVIGVFIIAEFIINIIVFVNSKKIKSIIDLKGQDEFSNELIEIILEDVLRNYYFSLVLLCLFCSIFFFLICICVKR